MIASFDAYSRAQVVPVDIKLQQQSLIDGHEV